MKEEIKNYPGTSVLTSDTWEETLTKHLYLFDEEEIEFILSKVRPEIRLEKEKSVYEERQRIIGLINN